MTIARRARNAMILYALIYASLFALAWILATT